jgi:hypothetical protein
VTDPVTRLRESIESSVHEHFEAKMADESERLTESSEAEISLRMVALRHQYEAKMADERERLKESMRLRSRDRGRLFAKSAR